MHGPVTKITKVKEGVDPSKLCSQHVPHRQGAMPGLCQICCLLCACGIALCAYLEVHNLPP